MRTRALSLVVLAACNREPAPPPSAPITVEVAPAPPITSGPLAQSPPPKPEAPEAPADFDKMAVAQAIGSVSIQQCAVSGGPTGFGHATITFDPNGTVSSVSVDSGPYPGTPAGDCVARAYATVKVPPFTRGSRPVRVGKAFILRP